MKSLSIYRWALAFASASFIPLGRSASNLAVPWSNSSYGPDGPWHAVLVRVGGTDSQDEAETEVALYPGGTYGSMILTKGACKKFHTPPCGNGGLWDPDHKEGTDTNFKASWIGTTNGIEAYGETYVQAMTMGDQTVSNVALVAIDEATVKSPTGKEYGPRVGTLALGVQNNAQTQDFITAKSDNTSKGFMPLAGLFNQSKVPSYTYGLHIGSASLEYGGSLVFGGYDKGRVLGNYANFTGDKLGLLDISLGVAKGGSPYPAGFKSKSGLLLNNSGIATSIPVHPNSGETSMYLPGKTCEQIAKYLPLIFDTYLQFYLWDTDNPYYEKLMTSPSYLDFTFDSGVKASNVSIKIPLVLLNLTLESPLADTPTPYFPCTPLSPGKDGTYRLGRAFMQAAFFGQNFYNSVSWLGQAPGPGDAKNGLGENRQDLARDATSIETSDDDGTTFYTSWKDYWSPLAEDGTQTGTPSLQPSAQVSVSLAPSVGAGGMTVGAKAGVGIAVAIVALAGIGALVWYLRRRKMAALSAERAARAQHSPSVERLSLAARCPFDCPVGKHAAGCPYGGMVEAGGEAVHMAAHSEREEVRYELPGSEVPLQELEGSE